MRQSRFWKLVNSRRFLTPAYIALGVVQIIAGTYRHHSDDDWFGGLWIVVGVFGLFLKPENAELINLNLDSSSHNGKSNGHS